MKDYRLSIEDILPFEHGNNRCLFMSMAILQEYRDTDATNMLRQAFDKKIKMLEGKGVYIKDVVIDCVNLDEIEYSIKRLNARYIKNSYNGKIYYTNDMYSNKIVPKISLELLNKDNIKPMALIQYEIFNKYWCGYADYIKELKSRENNLPVSYIIKYKRKNVGIVGLYELKDYPDVIWLNWLGILPEYRNLGIGTEALFKIIKIAKTYNRKEFRLVTYKVWNSKAQRIYEKTLKIAEPYKNEYDWQKGIKEGKAMIFSSSLDNRGCRIKKWNNKYIDLNDDIRLHNESMRLLKQDKLIN